MSNMVLRDASASKNNSSERKHFIGRSSLTLPQVRKPAMWAFDINVNGKSNTNAMQDQGRKSIKK